MKKLTSTLLCLALSSSLYSSEYSVELLSGVVSNMKEDITNHREGEDDIVIEDAKLVTHAQSVPYYYGIRFAKWSEDDTAWEIEHLHQKLYIDDPAKETSGKVTQWEITDGLNFFTLNKAYKTPSNGMVYRVGGGIVIAHPDITIEGETNHKAGNGAIVWGEGYHLAGFVVQASAQKQWNLNKIWYLSTELRATYAKAYVPIASGGVEVQNRALHFNYGVGYRF
ncbi:MAG: hypothetical protein U9R37_05540 [Campylobacterota bacterium]|nr:hypothetical protein [Campylobacterota bacterium]